MPYRLTTKYLLLELSMPATEHGAHALDPFSMRTSSRFARRLISQVIDYPGAPLRWPNANVCLAIGYELQGSSICGAPALGETASNSGASAETIQPLSSSEASWSESPCSLTASHGQHEPQSSSHSASRLAKVLGFPAALARHSAMRWPTFLQ